MTPQANIGKLILYYDGNCGVCHRFVKFILLAERHPDFLFAPLQGETFEERILKGEQRDFPDSIVVETKEGELLFRWTATRFVLNSFGGFWKVFSGVMFLIPCALGDIFYDSFASIRHAFFRQPESSCPLVKESLRNRFLR